MSDIPQLEQRIAVALERIRTGVDALAAPQDNSELVAAEARADALAAELAGIQAQLSAAKEVEAEVLALRTKLAEADAEKGDLLSTIQSLQGVNADLRAAAAEGLSDPDVINKALVADLEALQTARAADLRDIETLLAELAPIAQEA
ncbi:hypothetical protein [Dinoroseobacter sp. S76]|uniref:hypothetical protein n=1 Tax=Dinoroseobacter sp. S76 TaxID=3415124 RepID=UPI003C7DFF08